MSGLHSILAHMRILGLALILLGIGLPPAGLLAAEVTLAWEAIRDPDAARYRIYHREADGQYDFRQPIWEGAATSCSLTGLADGERHYFVGRSIDAIGNESANSDEILFHAPAGDTGEDALPSPPADPVSKPQPVVPQPPATETLILYDADREAASGTYWTILDDDPPGAYAVTVYDAVRQSDVTDLVGSWINNSFQLNRIDGEPLIIADRERLPGEGSLRLTWDLKNDLYFFVSVVLQTSAGEKTLYYTPSNFDLLGKGPFIHHGLGATSVDGRWHTHERDLVADLWDAQPDVSLKGVKAIHIRGQVQVDDILLDRIP